MNRINNGRGQLLSVFLTVLVLSFFIFYTYNQHLHRRTTQVAYEVCVKNRQLAANQRRIILALLTLAEAEFQSQRPLAITRAGEALARIPKFDCRR